MNRVGSFMLKNNVFGYFCILILVIVFSMFPMDALADNDEDIVVVIDPGHGGENLGADYGGYTEKEVTMTVAKAMYEELSKYEGITVYMTRTEDEDLSLLERAEFAKEVDADFLFCLHFNMSISHNKYGSEVWVSAFGEPYKEAYTFAEIQMQEFIDYGLFNRGIKTRINDEGTDYYGIIRHCTEFDIPCALIEHAHFDHEKDTAFLQDETDLVYLGILDATAVAKYFGLSSEKLGVDYSNYPKSDIEIPIKAVKPDSTEPDVVYIEEESVREEGDKVSFTVSAQDYDSPILYYAFSVNGGKSFGELYEWTGRENMLVTFERPRYDEISLSVVVFNQYDLYSVSNEIPVSVYNEPIEKDENIEETVNQEDAEVVSQDAIVLKKEEPKKGINLQNGLVLALAITGSLLVLMIALKITFIIINRKKKK